MTALHGFLGLPSDWNEVPCAASARKPNWLPLFDELPPRDALPLLAARLNALLRGPDTLLGYSMGGRIALHMLLDDVGHGRWNRAVIVSASPGLTRESEREARLAGDKKWGSRFLTGAWDEVVADWNSQPVFTEDGATPLSRLEMQFNRHELSEALDKGSVGRQEDLRDQLAQLEIPILWIAGERDAKYRKLAEECAALNPGFQCRILQGAGHRSPWTAPGAFNSAVQAFLNE